MLFPRQCATHSSATPRPSPQYHCGRLPPPRVVFAGVARGLLTLSLSLPPRSPFFICFCSLDARCPSSSTVTRFSHKSEAVGTTMGYSVFTPGGHEGKQLPVSATAGTQMRWRCASSLINQSPCLFGFTEAHFALRSTDSPPPPPKKTKQQTTKIQQHRNNSK